MKKFIFFFFAVLILSSCASRPQYSKEERAAAFQMLGEEYYNNGNYTPALKNLLRAYGIVPNDPYLLNSLGLVYMAKKKHSLAQKYFEKALKIKPDYTPAKNNLGAAYLKQEKWEPAIRLFKQVSEDLLYDTPEIPLSNIGWAYLGRKEYRKANDYFLRSLEIKPGFIIAVHGLTLVYIEAGFPEQAVKYLHRQLEKNPEQAVLHLDLAKAYDALKDYDNAKKFFNYVLQLAPPTSPLAREAEKRLLELK